MYYNFKLRIGTQSKNNKLKYVKGRVDLAVLIASIEPLINKNHFIFVGYRPGLAVVLDAVTSLDLDNIITFETNFTDTGNYLRGSRLEISSTQFVKKLVAAALYAAEHTGNPRYEVFCLSDKYPTLHRLKISYRPIVPPTLTIKLDV